MQTVQNNLLCWVIPRALVGWCGLLKEARTDAVQMQSAVDS